MVAEMTTVELNQRLVQEYRESGGKWPTTMRNFAEWLIERGLSPTYKNQLASQIAEDLARAMRQESYVDPQGRPVRTKHAARIKDENNQQRFVWDDIRTASRDHMEISLQQQRQAMVVECLHVKRAMDSFNENRKPDIPIQIEFNFVPDIAEAEAVVMQSAA